MSKNVLIYGATVTAAAIASILKENCTVINHGYNCAYEYADSYRADKIYESEAYSNGTKAFISDMKSRNILKDSFLCPLYLAGLTAKYFLDCASEFYLGCTLESVTENADGVTAVMYLNGEQITLSGSMFIDTTDYGKNRRVLFTSLFAENKNPQILCDAEKIVRGRFESEYYLKTDVNENESYTDAFMRVNNMWCESLWKKLPDFRLASVANDFAVYYDKPVTKKTDNCIIHIPSSSFANAAESFEGGLKCVSLI